MMTTKIQIRKANNNDLLEIIKIIENHYAKYGDHVNLDFYDADLKDIEKNYFAQGGYFWVAEQESAIIGTCVVVPDGKKNIELKRLYVVDYQQDNGIGSKLFDTAVAFARENNFKKLFLWTDDRYSKAKKFYEYKNLRFVKKILKKDADLPYQACLYELIL